jgi:hypothetical protein
MKLYSQAWECMESVAHEGHTPHGFFGLLTMILGFVKQKPKSFLQVFQLGSLGKWRPNGPNLLQISKGSSIYQVRISFDRHPTRYYMEVPFLCVRHFVRPTTLQFSLVFGWTFNCNLSLD